MSTSSVNHACFTSTHSWSGFAVRGFEARTEKMGVNTKFNTITIEANIEDRRAEDTSALLREGLLG